MNDGAKDGGCTWIRTRKPEATALQAAELAMLFNTSENDDAYGRTRTSPTPVINPESHYLKVRRSIHLSVMIRLVILTVSSSD